MRLAALALALLSHPAFAQWGIGLSPGTSCNSPFGPARPAVNGQDEITNLSGQLAARNQRIEDLKKRRDQIDDYIDRAKEDMGAVLTSSAIGAIEMHRKYRYSFNSYQQSCGARPGPAVGGATDPEMFNDNVPGPVNANLPPPPPGFCVANPATHAYTNMWRKFVEDDGTVNRGICDHLIAGIATSREPSRVDTCHQGMVDYYDRMGERERLDDEITKLDKEARAEEHQLEKIKDEITEGTYCPYCAAQRQGYTSGSGGNSLVPLIGGVAMIGLSLMLHQQQGPPPPPYMMRPMPMMSYGGPGFPATPYAAPLPGYNGMMGPPGQAVYGAVPGSIGSGAFACNGTSPVAMATPFGAQGTMPIFGQQSPFNNPYANPMMNPMFNSGAGPGWGFPMYGSGYPGFQSPFGSPFGNPMMLGQSPFGTSPFGQFGMNPAMMGMNPGLMGMNPGLMGMNSNPFGFNPYNPFGSNPYANLGLNPFGGGMSPFGPGYPYGGPMLGNAFAPAMLPYMGSNPSGGGYPFGTPYGPGYGYPGGVMPGYGNSYYSPYGNSFGNLYSQLGYMNQGLGVAGGGTYYGGGGGYSLGAPAILPYMGSAMGSPIYNAPGSLLGAPGQGQRAPAILPYSP